MELTLLDYKMDDGHPSKFYRWQGSGEEPIFCIVQIAHGMAEWAMRYKYFAKNLNLANAIVYANDHRGHGLTSDSQRGLGYVGGKDGFERMVKDMKELNDHIRKEHPGLPIVLFGHSMGSFLTQRFIQVYGSSIDAVVLSGSNGSQGPIIYPGLILAKLETRFKGEWHRSQLLTDLTFGSYNKKFKPNRTGFDWLTRDEDIVDKYIKDPLCGKVFTSSFFYTFLRGLKDIVKKKNLKSIPKDLPIHMIGGSRDPVGNFGKGIKKLHRMYKKAGLENISYKIYENARHELLNETNKDEVIDDLIMWIFDRVKAQ